MSVSLHCDSIRLSLRVEKLETGWKKLHGDVFRFPPFRSLFSALTGVGFQILVLSVLVMTLSVIGVYYHYSRGALYATIIILYALTGGALELERSYVFRSLHDAFLFLQALLATCLRLSLRRWADERRNGWVVALAARMAHVCNFAHSLSW